MREIKFRIWDKQNNCFYEPTYRAYEGQLEDLFIDPVGQLIMRKMVGWSVETHHESLFPDRFEIMQFTGLKDKNGKEIYEGDVLANGIHINWVVIFEEASFKVKFPDPINTDRWVLNRGMAEMREVIGNIYENHDLIGR